jgi:TonB family protein
MNIPEEFGKYLLLKKLTEDPLGETFRAGRVGAEGMEQVVLLRVFNGKGLDGERLWSKISGRAGIQKILKSPNIGSGVDLGRVRSFPYTAYDYIPGKNLATLFAQAARQHSPIPTDHALLIAERISLALAAANESRLQDERVLHGFVVPHLVMISNEGETRLLGFEVAPGLRDQAAGGWQEGAVRPYLSPETLKGSPLGKSDDVWSLGAILFELLTGERLPEASGEGLGARIDGAVLANDGAALPAPVAALLKKSLVPHEQRIADAVTWHKTLSKLMIDGHFSPTTFNLAFFMHNLFRDEIERENQEIQAEKKLELQQRPAAPAPVAAPVAAPQDLREVTGVREATWSGTRAQVAKEAEPSKKGLWMGIAAAVVIALGAGGYFAYDYFIAKPAAESKTAAAAALPATQPAALPGAVPPANAPAAPAGPTPEEIQAQIQQMFEARSKEIESKFKTQYDERIKELQQQLEDSRKAPAETPKQDRPAPQQEPPPPAVETRTAQRTEPAAPPPAPATVPAAQPPAGNTTAGDRVESPPAPLNPAPAPPVQAPPRQPQVQVGDLVQAGPGVVAPKLVSQPDPRYPPAAQRLNRAAQVDIKVLVDERGRVLDSELLGAKAGFGFDEAALDAARRAVFQPATKDGVRVKMWRTMRVNFKPPVR